MMYLIVNWILSAVALIIVEHIVPGFQVRNFGTALIAALVIGLINSTLGLLLKILTLPLTIVTFGLFLFIINAFVLRITSGLVSGFHVEGFGAALVGAIVLALVTTILRHIVFA